MGKRERRIQALLDQVSMELQNGKGDAAVLSMRHYSKLKTRNQVEQLLCYRCGKVIMPGDSVHIKYNGVGFRHLKIYHLDCWWAVFV